MTTATIKTLAYALASYYPNAKDTEKVIMNAAAVAAGANALGSAIPGLAIPATIISCFGTVWVMYGTLCEKLGIELKENILKLLARAVLANLAANLGGTIAAMLAGMLVPGASMLMSAVITFLTVYLAGFIFLQLVLNLAQRSRDPHSFSDISASEMKREVKNVKVSAEDLAAAKQAFEASRSAGAKQAG